MIRVTFHLHGDLPSLAHDRSGAQRERQSREPGSVKDALEALGIPHTEIDLLLAGGRPVGFAYLVRDGNLIEAFPCPAVQQTGITFPSDRLQPRPLSRDRFVCDLHLGKLARLLRMLGFDTLYDRGWREADIAELAVAEERAVLTCSRSLLKRKSIACGRLVRSRKVDEQAVEVVRRFGAPDPSLRFARCSACNGELQAVAKQNVLERIPPETRSWRDDYYLCQRCDHLYWEGTHVARLRARIAKILGSGRDRSPQV